MSSYDMNNGGLEAEKKTNGVNGVNGINGVKKSENPLENV